MIRPQHPTHLRRSAQKARAPFWAFAPLTDHQQRQRQAFEQAMKAGRLAQFHPEKCR